MIADLAALTPPLVVAAAFIIGLVLFLRHQMGSGQASEDDDGPEIPDDGRNVAHDEPAHPPSSDPRKV